MEGGTSHLPSPGQQWPRILTASRQPILQPSDDSRSVSWADQRAGWWALGHGHRSVTPLPVLRQAGQLNIGTEGIGGRGFRRPRAPALGGREDLDGHHRQIVDVLVSMGATPKINLSNAVDPPLVVPSSSVEGSLRIRSARATARTRSAESPTLPQAVAPWTPTPDEKGQPGPGHKFGNASSFSVTSPSMSKTRS